MSTFQGQKKEKDPIKFVMPDIQLNSKIFNPHKRKSKVEEANQLRDLKYQYFQKHEEERKQYRQQRQFSSRDTQIKFSKYRDSASFLLLYRKTFGQSPSQQDKYQQMLEDVIENDKENEILSQTGLDIKGNKINNQKYQTVKNQNNSSKSGKVRAKSQNISKKLKTEYDSNKTPNFNSKNESNINNDLHLNYKEQQFQEKERAKEKVMTIEDMLGQFTKENEEHVQQFLVDRSKLKSQNFIEEPNQGISQAIDKTFSRVENEKNLRKSTIVQNRLRKRLQSAHVGLSNTKSDGLSQQLMIDQIKLHDRLENNKFQIFEKKLKQAIIDRLDDKEKFLNICDINELVGCLKESKMSIENELDDLKQIKNEIQHLNQFSKMDATKVEKKLTGVTNRLNKLKIIQDEYLTEYSDSLILGSTIYHNNDQRANHSITPQTQNRPKSSINRLGGSQRRSLDLQKQGIQETRKLNLLKQNKAIGIFQRQNILIVEDQDEVNQNKLRPQSCTLKQRQTNKHLSIKEQLEFEGIKLEDLKMREEFKMLRGDHGIKKTILEQNLQEDLDNFHEQIMTKKSQKQNTHSYFISQKTKEEISRENRKRSIAKNDNNVKNQQETLDDDKNSTLVSIPDSPLYSKIHYQKMEFIQALQNRQKEMREQSQLKQQKRKLEDSQTSQTLKQLAYNTTGFQTQSHKKQRPMSSMSSKKTTCQTPLTAQRFFINQQVLKKQKQDLINQSYDYARKEQLKMSNLKKENQSSNMQIQNAHLIQGGIANSTMNTTSMQSFNQYATVTNKESPYIQTSINASFSTKHSYFGQKSNSLKHKRQILQHQRRQQQDQVRQGNYTEINANSSDGTISQLQNYQNRKQSIKMFIRDGSLQNDINESQLKEREEIDFSAKSNNSFLDKNSSQNKNKNANKSSGGLFEDSFTISPYQIGIKTVKTVKNIYL
eukprot:403371003